MSPQCQAGRVLTHPSMPAFQTPCPHDAPYVLAIIDHGLVSLCRDHINLLEDLGVIVPGQ